MASIEETIDKAISVAVARAEAKINAKANEVIAKIPTPNYKIVKSTAVTTLNSTTMSTSITLSMTTTGKPVFLCVCGDFNPTVAGAWIYVHIYRGTTILTTQVIQAANNSQNQCIALSFIDAPSAGTYTYKALISLGNSSHSGTLKDNYSTEYPQFMAFEIH